MGKVLLGIGTGLFPYSILAALWLGGQTGNPGVLLLVPAALTIGLVCAVVILTLSAGRRWAAREAALLAMAVKLAQIPAYLVFFWVGLSGLVMVQFAAVTVIVWVVDLFTIGISGLAGLAAVLRCRSEGRLAGKAAVLNGILQFIFCADVFSAVWVYQKSKEKRV